MLLGIRVCIMYMRAARTRVLLLLLSSYTCSITANKHLTRFRQSRYGGFGDFHHWTVVINIVGWAAKSKTVMVNGRASLFRVFFAGFSWAKIIELSLRVYVVTCAACVLYTKLFKLFSPSSWTRLLMAV